MPVYLPAPEHRPSGPDGKGWNRLALWSMAGDECALQPLSYEAFVEQGGTWEQRDTRRARYGGFGRCTREGACDGCPVAALQDEEPVELRAFTERILVRIWPPDGSPCLMNHPEKGWSSFCYRWSWPRLARLRGWTAGPRFTDEHSQAFWLDRKREPVWRGMSPDEQRAYVRDLCRIENERARARGEPRRVEYGRRAYVGDYPDR